MMHHITLGLECRNCYAVSFWADGDLFRLSGGGVEAWRLPVRGPPAFQGLRTKVIRFNYKARIAKPLVATIVMSTRLTFNLKGFIPALKLRPDTLNFWLHLTRPIPTLCVYNSHGRFPTLRLEKTDKMMSREIFLTKSVR